MVKMFYLCYIYGLKFKSLIDMKDKLFLVCIKMYGVINIEYYIFISIKI